MTQVWNPVDLPGFARGRLNELSQFKNDLCQMMRNVSGTEMVSVPHPIYDQLPNCDYRVGRFSPVVFQKEFTELMEEFSKLKQLMTYEQFRSFYHGAMGMDHLDSRVQRAMEHCFQNFSPDEFRSVPFDPDVELVRQRFDAVKLAPPGADNPIVPITLPSEILKNPEQPTKATPPNTPVESDIDDVPLEAMLRTGPVQAETEESDQSGIEAARLRLADIHLTEDDMF